MSQSLPSELSENQNKFLASLTDPVFDGPRGCPAGPKGKEGPPGQDWNDGRGGPKGVPSVALVTMTKNGIKRLPALFASVLGFATKAVILDTGSTDGSVEWLREQKFFPMILHGGFFENFEVTRNRLMNWAQGTADWLLLVDDDMTLKFTVPQQQVLDSLTGEAYLMEHLDPMRYWVTRLVRGNKLWQYKGVTHEYLVGGGSTLPHLSGVGIIHNFDHRQPEKFTRDLQLLTADLARDPDDVRTVFYLANTLRDMGKTAAAIRFYCMRANMGGWDEEVFMSMYEAARLAEDPAAMVKAWEFRPTRAEPLAWLAEFYKVKGDEQWRVWESKRVAIPFPEKDVLFVNTLAYGSKKT